MITKLSLSGYKSIRELRDLELGRLNVLIGANGAGKSNLLSVFRLLAQAMEGNEFGASVIRAGGASSMLFDARTPTPMTAKLELNDEGRGYLYEVRLGLAARDFFQFQEERYGEAPPESSWVETPGSLESMLAERARQGQEGPKTIRRALTRILALHLNDTSSTSRLMKRWSVEDGLRLKEDGGNLAPVLRRLSEYRAAHFARICDSIRLIAPFFAEFVLEPEGNTLLLRWRARGSDRVFEAHQLSDGTLRAMVLITLLQQPREDLPGLLLLDEPELGLHPYAVTVIAGLLRSASLHTQVVMATQSTYLLDHFDPGEVVVVDRSSGDGESLFTRLSPGDLKEWLDEYSLSELWLKNVLGGRPR